AAPVEVDASYTCPSFAPILPGKFRFVVEMQTSGPLMRPNVSFGPPRQAAHEASSEIVHPASSKIESRVWPSRRSVRIACEISVVAGTRNVSTATLRPRITCAALTKSLIFPPVHEPMYER